MVMIKKAPGVTLVDKLRAILVMEADFTFGNRLLFGNKMLKNIERKGQYLLIVLQGLGCVQLMFQHTIHCFLI